MTTNNLQNAGVNAPRKRLASAAAITAAAAIAASALLLTCEYSGNGVLNQEHQKRELRIHRRAPTRDIRSNNNSNDNLWSNAGSLVSVGGDVVSWRSWDSPNYTYHDKGASVQVCAQSQFNGRCNFHDGNSTRNILCPFAFAEWTGAVTSSDSCATVNIASDTTSVTANFIMKPMLSVSISHRDRGNVRVNDSIVVGIATGTSSNTRISRSVTFPDSGAVLEVCGSSSGAVLWERSDSLPSNDSCVTVTMMNEDVEITANIINVLTVNRNTAAGGTVSVGGTIVLGQNDNSTSTVVHDFQSGQACVVASANYTFVGWLVSMSTSSTNACVSIDLSDGISRTLMATFATTPITGSFIDPRDEQTYNTVKIGGLTWMAQNLNYETSSDSWCYNNNAASCVRYGRLYNWNAARAQACPDGWRLPDNDDWDNLLFAVGYVYAQAFGFFNVHSNNDLDVGGFRDTGGNFSGIGGVRWWSATEDGDNARNYGRSGSISSHSGAVGIGFSDGVNKANAFSVRCVRD